MHPQVASIESEPRQCCLCCHWHCSAATRLALAMLQPDHGKVVHIRLFSTINRCETVDIDGDTEVAGNNHPTAGLAIHGCGQPNVAWAGECDHHTTATESRSVMEEWSAVVRGEGEHLFLTSALRFTRRSRSHPPRLRNQTLSLW